MNYTLHQLKIFLKVCETRSVTKASEELFLTQPAVSIQLKKLQDQFDIPLTEIIGRKIYITDFGEYMAKVCREILDKAEQIDQTVNEYKGLLTGKISFSVVSTGKYVLPYFLNDFLRKYPEIEVSIDVTNKSRVIESLKKNETDFSLVSVLPQDVDIHRIELMPNKLFLVASPEFLSLEEGLSNHIAVEEVGNHTLIFREEGSATRKAMENYLQANNVKVRKKLELVSNEAVKQAVIAGLGYSILPLIGIRNELINKSLQVIQVSGLPVITSWNLIYNKGKNLSPASIALTKHLEEKKRKIIEKYFYWVD